MPPYLTLLQTALATEIEAALPIITLLLIVGIATATLQATFQLEDTALNLLPKTVAMIVIALFGASVPLACSKRSSWPGSAMRAGGFINHGRDG